MHLCRIHSCYRESIIIKEKKTFSTQAYYSLYICRHNIPHSRISYRRRLFSSLYKELCSELTNQFKIEHLRGVYTLGDITKRFCNIATTHNKWDTRTSQWFCFLFCLNKKKGKIYSREKHCFVDVWWSSCKSVCCNEQRCYSCFVLLVYEIDSKLKHCAVESSQNISLFIFS